MHIEVNFKRLIYKLDIKGKYSVIQGDSGNGKTNLCRLLLEREFGDRTIKVKSDVPIIALERRFRGNELSGITGHIVVIDELCMILQQPNLAEILKESDNYFIIISRDNLDFLPLCVENIYDMKTNGKIHWIEQKYHVSNIRKFSRIRHIVTEDSASGLEFFKNHYSVSAESAHSKTEIVSYLANRIQKEPDYNDVLVVYDAAAFAYNKPYLDRWILQSGKRVQILDWYSFEHYVLTQKPFMITLTQDKIGKRWESLEQASESYLKNCIEYSKRTFPSCLKKESSCNDCRRIKDCKFKHSSFLPDLEIKGETVAKTNRLGVF